MAAHYTAKFTFVSNSECMWLHDIPDFLSLLANMHVRCNGRKKYQTSKINKDRNNIYLFIFYSLYKISSRIVHEKIFRLN